MRTLLKGVSTCAVVVMLAGVVGCSSGGGATEAASGSAADVGKSLYAQLGSADGVAKLADQFGANIASNPTLNALSDSVAVGEVKTGLTNDIIKASAMTPPSGTTLTSALQGKGLDASGFDALSKCLTDAGTAQGLSSEVMDTLTSLVMEPARKSLGL